MNYAKPILIAGACLFCTMFGAWVWGEFFGPSTFKAEYEAQKAEAEALRSQLKTANTSLAHWQTAYESLALATDTATTINQQITHSYNEIEQKRISATHRANLVELRDSATANHHRARFDFSLCANTY